MQLETVPARVARVVVRPGTGGAEAWALGTSTARVPGYSKDRTGQVVFLKYTRATGWVVAGPPRSRSGAIVNPELSSFDLTASGEGWAVGDAGTLVHKLPGSDRWTVDDQSGALTPQTLNSVSLGSDGSGYAVGVGPSMLRLQAGSWNVEQPAAEMTAQTSELHAVANVSASDVWVIATGQVTGVDSTNLLIYRKSGGSWTRVTTGQAIFDNPPATAQGGVLNRSAEAGAVAADARGVWIGGRMFPRSTANPDGDPAPGDSSRAFVLRLDKSSGEWTSYCPDVYSERTTAADLTKMCDEPFPTAPFHVASLSIVPGGDVFAGGLGLFRFSKGGWFREPNANGYLISISMGSNTEGFVATPGRSLGSGGLIRSNATTIGHWTASPKPSAIARWAQPQDQLLTSLAFDPSGSGRAIAVGGSGSAVMFSGSAWDSINPITGLGLRGVAWPSGDTPWAVGQNGVVMRLKDLAWQMVDPLPTTSSLYAVAFRSASEGVAVGLGGTIVSYRNGRWRDDSPASISKDLYGIVALTDRYVAVGRDGAVVEGTPGNWRLRRDARSLLLRPGAAEAPTLYAVATDGDRVILGGQDSALIQRTPGGTYQQFESPVQGTVLALAAAQGVVYASLSPNDQKFRGESPAAQRGTLMRFDGTRWADVGLSRRVTALRDKVDTSQFDDPIYGLDMSSAKLGWGVGGSPQDLKDAVEGHFRSLPTGAVYRVAYGADPAQPASDAELNVPTTGVPFAAFGESWCGVGLCSMGMGTGTQSDKVALSIRDEINRASMQPGGPRFVLFTGNMRRAGIPDEMMSFRRYLDGFRIPVFSSMGSLDRFAGIDVAQTTGGATGSSASSGSNDYWKSVFSDRPAPWGEAPPLASFRPVAVGAAPPVAGAARTHYAFDYLERGSAKMRVVVVDSSTKSYGTPQEQNPPESQQDWLSVVLNEARTVLRIPTIVLMNQPTVLPSDEQIPNWTAVQDQQLFEDTVAAAGVSAVITGGARVNARDTLKLTVPLFVVGGGGAPLGREQSVQANELASKLPTDGYYHAWHLMRLETSRLNVLGQAAIDDQAFPVVESLAMHSFYGSVIPAGQTTDISAFVRGLNGGFSDPDQAKTTYLTHGRGERRCRYKSQGNGYCISGAAILPHIEFYSEDSSRAEFVQRSPHNSREPLKAGKEIFYDPGGAAGLLCTFRPGKVGINVVAGMHRSRMVIDVAAGQGPCTETVFKEPPVVRGVRKVAPPAPEPAPEEPRIFPRVRPHQEAIVLFPPPPAPAVAPAPPGAPGVGRKEEHEVEYETEKHEHGHSSRALSVARRRTIAEDATWPILGGAAFLAFAGAVVAAAAQERRRGAAAHARWRR